MRACRLCVSARKDNKPHDALCSSRRSKIRSDFAVGRHDEIAGAVALPERSCEGGICVRSIAAKGIDEDSYRASLYKVA